MPKPTTEITATTANVPFYFVRMSPDLFKAVEDHRVLLGFNKKKVVEIMATLFLSYHPATALPAKKKKAKR